jgi:hypothetical protein
MLGASNPTSLVNGSFDLDSIQLEPPMLKQVKDIIKMLNDEKLVDSLKGVFTLTIDVRKQIVDVRKKMENLSKDLSLQLN